MKARILKTMLVDGRKVVAGDIMDVKGWRHAKALARNRYIQILEEEPAKEKPKAEIVEDTTESKPKAPKKKSAE